MEVAWSLPGPAPDLLLLYVLWLALYRNSTGTALVAGFLGGLAQDLVDLGGPVGTQALCKVVAAFLPEWAHFILVPGNRITGLILVVGATLIGRIIELALLQTFEPGGVIGIQAFLDTTMLLLWNLALAWVLVCRMIPPRSPM